MKHKVKSTFISMLAVLLCLGGCSTTAGGEGAAGEQGVEEPAGGDEAVEPVEGGGLPNLSRPYEGVVTAAQPTERQFENLSEAGVETVINLRTAEEMEELGWNEEARAEELGVEYVNIPIAGPDDLTRDNVERFDEAVEEAEEDVLVHCSTSNRVGALFALRAHWIEGKDAEEALEIGKKAGLGELEDAVRERIEE